MTDHSVVCIINFFTVPLERTNKLPSLESKMKPTNVGNYK